MSRFSDNLSALSIVFRKEGQPLSPEEKDTISLYSGWGGLSGYLDMRWIYGADLAKLNGVKEKIRELFKPFEDDTSPTLFEKFDSSSRYRDMTTSAIEIMLGIEESQADSILDSATRSTLTSFYTPPSLVLSMWEGFQKAGFSGGRILEPGAGSGIFIGLMPEEIRKNSRIVAVEKDVLTARVLRSLYGDDPSVRIVEGSFEDAALPAGRFDLVVGNFPFGSVNVVPTVGKYARQKMRIHDFFLLRSSELLRDGGMMGVLTTTHFLDNQSQRSRTKAKDSGLRLVAPFRLSEDVFQSSGTEVQSDLLFFGKNRDLGIEPLDFSNSVPWVAPGESAPQTPGLFVNSVYVGKEGRERILGSTVAGTNRFGEPVLVVREKEWKTKLQAISGAIPEGFFGSVPSDGEPVTPDQDPVYSGKIPGTFVSDESGGVYVIGPGGILSPVQGSRVDMIRNLIPVRDAVMALVQAESDPSSEEGHLESLRVTLNKTYDAFFKKFGAISEKAVSQAFSSDPGYPMVLALEIYDSISNRVEKAAIFRERAVLPKLSERKARTAHEALAISLDEKGRIDPGYMESVSGRVFDDLRAELGSRIFLQADGSFEVAERYLSGNVREKLAEARLLSSEDPTFLQNVEALEAAQPAELLPGQITVNLGVPWIPVSDIQDFVADLFAEEGGENWVQNKVYRDSDFSLRHIPMDNTWVMAVSRSFRKDAEDILVKYETPRKDFFGLLDDALNQRRPTIYDTVIEDGTERRVVNLPQTEMARDRIDVIRESFGRWIWKDQDRSDRLVREYNERFNVWALPKYDGSHLTFPGMSPHFEMRQHQKDVVWRTLLSGNTLYAHVVGAGKTAEMIASAYEQKRLGHFNKPMIIVPNHMLRQFASEAQRLYPGARILAISKGELDAANRKLFAAKVTVGSWDLIVTTHSVFEKLKLSPSEETRLVEAMLWEYKDFLMNISIEDSGKKNSAKARAQQMSVKRIEERVAKMEARIKELREGKTKDDLIPFDQMGVDSLFVDEAHYFKGLGIVTKQDRIPGLTGTESQRALDLWLKTRWLMDHNGGERGVHFATGTPVANIMAELYNMQRYLSPLSLEKSGLSAFDAWSSTFGQVVTQFELSPEGTGYRKNARFAKYVNVPELMSQYLQFADVKTRNDIKLPVPDATTETLSYPASPFMKKHMKELAVRATMVRNREVDPSVDNMLNIMTDARKAAISSAFVDRLSPDDPGSKVNGLVKNLLSIHRETERERLAQIVFCDYGTPGGDEKYSVYDEIKNKLVVNGVEASEVAFIHDAVSDDAKEALFQRVRDGRVRILIGSTQKMGTGTNVQTRLVALHNLDIPWRPADWEQRLGRIVRQGNSNGSVRIFAYTTQDSIDVFMLETLKRKHAFIEQVMTGKIMDREMDEDDDSASYQKIMAASTGNPAIRRKIEVDDEIRKLQRQKQAWLDEKFNAGRQSSRLEEEVARFKAEIAEIEKDLGAVFPDPWEIRIGEEVFQDRGEAAKTFISAWSTTPEGGTVAKYGEFSINRPRGVQFKLEIRRAGTHLLSYDQISSRLFGRIEAQLKGLSISLENLKDDLKDTESKLAVYRKVSGSIFEKEEELASLVREQAELVQVLDEEAKRIQEEKAKGDGAQEKFFELTLDGESRRLLIHGIEELNRLPEMPDSVRIEIEKTGMAFLKAYKNEVPVFLSEMKTGNPMSAGLSLTITDTGEALNILREQDRLLSSQDSGLMRISNFVSTKEFYLTTSLRTQERVSWGSSMAQSSLSNTPQAHQFRKAVESSRISEGITGLLETLSSEKADRVRVVLDRTPEEFRLVATDGSRMVWLIAQGGGPSGRIETNAAGAEKIASLLKNRTPIPEFAATASGTVVSIGDESVAIPTVSAGNDERKVLSIRPPAGNGVDREELLGILEGLPEGSEVRIGTRQEPSGPKMTIHLMEGALQFTLPSKDSGSSGGESAFWISAEKTVRFLSKMEGVVVRLSPGSTPDGRILPFWSSEFCGWDVTVLSMPLSRSKELETRWKESPNGKEEDVRLKERQEMASPPPEAHDDDSEHALAASVR